VRYVGGPRLSSHACDGRACVLADAVYIKRRHMPGCAPGFCSWFVTACNGRITWLRADTRDAIPLGLRIAYFDTASFGTMDPLGRSDRGLYAN